VILIFCINIVYGLSIESPSNRVINFEPRLNVNYTFKISGAEHINTYIAGDLNQYVTLIDENQNSGPRSFNIKLSLPSELTAGTYTILVGARESDGSGGNIGVISGLQSKIKIIVSYPGKFLEYDIQISSHKTTDDIIITYNVKNIGDTRVNKLYINTLIVDENNITVININSTNYELNASSEITFNETTHILKDGRYNAISKLYYDEIVSNNTFQNEFFIYKVGSDDTTAKVGSGIVSTNSVATSAGKSLINITEDNSIHISPNFIWATVFFILIALILFSAYYFIYLPSKNNTNNKVSKEEDFGIKPPKL
jgi:hypothetical protein